MFTIRKTTNMQTFKKTLEACHEGIVMSKSDNLNEFVLRL